MSNCKNQLGLAIDFYYICTRSCNVRIQQTAEAEATLLLVDLTHPHLGFLLFR